MADQPTTVHELRRLAGVKPYKPAEPWTWAFDIETGRVLRELSQDQRSALAVAVVFGLDSPTMMEMAESMLRLPQHLSNLNDEALRAVACAVIAKRGGTAGTPKVRQK